MSAFKTLRDISIGFEEDLRRFSNELFTAKIAEPFEDVVYKKLNDLSLYTSKLRLVQAKSLSARQPTHGDDQTISNYSNAAKWKIVEQQIVKSITQSHHVKALLTASDNSLSPDMLERKEKIYEQLMKFKEKEIQLRHLDTTLKERQQCLEDVRQQWDKLLGRLRKQRANMEIGEDDHSSALSSKLHRLEGKLSSLRALLARLASSRDGDYDWLADPQRRLRALQLARQ